MTPLQQFLSNVVAVVVGTVLGHFVVVPWLAGLLGKRRAWPSRGFDGVMTGSHDGKLLECFDPAWHEARRWLWWWTRGHKLGRGAIAMVRGDQKFTVRVFVPPAVAPPKRFRGRRFHG